MPYFGFYYGIKQSYGIKQNLKDKEILCGLIFSSDCWLWALGPQHYSETYIACHVHSFEMHPQAIMDELPITQTKQTFKGPLACMKPNSKDKLLQRRVIVMQSFSRFMLVLFIDFMWTQEMVNDAFSFFCAQICDMWMPEYYFIFTVGQSGSKMTCGNLMWKMSIIDSYWKILAAYDLQLSKMNSNANP